MMHPAHPDQFSDPVQGLSDFPPSAAADTPAPTHLHPGPLPEPKPSPAASAAGHCPHAPYDEFFESIYRCAEGDPSRVPWAEPRPDPVLLHWLNREAWSLVRPGSRAAVVGCGLGDDVAELARRGYDVLGFDVSPTAVAWAARRHSENADRFIVADLLNLPGRMRHRFDLVVEVRTLQSFEPRAQPLAAQRIAEMLAPRGAVVVIAPCREAADDTDPADGPPWLLTPHEVSQLMTAHAGLCPCPRGVQLVPGEHGSRRPHLIGVFTRGQSD